MVNYPLRNGLVEAATWEKIEEIAFAVFARGQQLAAEQGLILVDTKYEMGRNSEGQIAIARAGSDDEFV